MRGCNLTVSIEKMTDSTSLRIKRIEVEGLFGLYHHVIDLNLEDRVTILHGPNGVGKTNIFKIIEMAFSDKTANEKKKSLLTIPFDKFSMKFTNESLALIEQNESRTVPKLQKGEVTEVIHSPREVCIDETSMDWLTRKRIDTRFISEQRTFRCDKKAQILPIMDEYARDLQLKIQNAMADYGKKAQDLDATLPQRLLDKTSLQILSSEQLKVQLVELKSEIEKFQTIGLLPEASIPSIDSTRLDNLDEAKRSMMTLYIDDNKEKLIVVKPLGERIKLFSSMLNSKLRNKEIIIDHEDGFRIRDRNHDPIPLTALSSGEQHEIVLAYDLLFKTVPNSLVLIDEPELSLHLTWQVHFLPDLLKIVKIANFDVIIATHSPFIIGNRRDLVVALEDKVQ